MATYSPSRTRATLGLLGVIISVPVNSCHLTILAQGLNIADFTPPPFRPPDRAACAARSGLMGDCCASPQDFSLISGSAGEPNILRWPTLPRLKGHASSLCLNSGRTFFTPGASAKRKINRLGARFRFLEAGSLHVSRKFCAGSENFTKNGQLATGVAGAVILRV